MINKFTTLLAQKDFKAAVKLFKELEEAEQVKILASLNTDKQQVNVDRIKTISILTRKLKPGKNYSDFYQAWLPPGADSTDKNALGKYFGFDEGCVFHAKNLNDSSEIVSIGLAPATPTQLQELITKYAETEAQRSQSIAKVADKMGKTEIYETVDVVF